MAYSDGSMKMKENDVTAAAGPAAGACCEWAESLAKKTNTVSG